MTEGRKQQDPVTGDLNLQYETNDKQLYDTSYETVRKMKRLTGHGCS